MQASHIQLPPSASRHTPAPAHHRYLCRPPPRHPGPPPKQQHSLQSSFSPHALPPPTTRPPLPPRRYRTCGLFVAPMTTTLSAPPLTPSNCTKNSVLRRRMASCSPALRPGRQAGSRQQEGSRPRARQVQTMRVADVRAVPHTTLGYARIYYVCCLFSVGRQEVPHDPHSPAIGGLYRHVFGGLYIG